MIVYYNAMWHDCYELWLQCMRSIPEDTCYVLQHNEDRVIAVRRTGNEELAKENYGTWYLHPGLETSKEGNAMYCNKDTLLFIQKADATPVLRAISEVCRGICKKPYSNDYVLDGKKVGGYELWNGIELLLLQCDNINGFRDAGLLREDIGFVPISSKGLVTSIQEVLNDN